MIDNNLSTPLISLRDDLLVFQDKKDEKYQCPIEACTKICTSFQQLSHHQQSHNPAAFQCSFCLKKYKMFGSFQNHLLKHQPKLIQKIQLPPTIPTINNSIPQIKRVSNMRLLRKDIRIRQKAIFNDKKQENININDILSTIIKSIFLKESIVKQKRQKRKVSSTPLPIAINDSEDEVININS